MRIAVLSDLHANLPFAEAAVRHANRIGSNKIVHLGDAIDLGPWPAETLDFLSSEGVEMIRGNHDEYPIMGVTPRLDAQLSSDIREHMEWTAAQLRSDHHALLAGLPTHTVNKIDQWLVRMQHFVLDGNRVTEEIFEHTPEAILDAFDVSEGEIVCFGHIHTQMWHLCDHRGYLNPGATGFFGEDGGVFAELVIMENAAWVEWHQVPALVTFRGVRV